MSKTTTPRQLQIKATGLIHQMASMYRSLSELERQAAEHGLITGDGDGGKNAAAFMAMRADFLATAQARLPVQEH